MVVAGNLLSASQDPSDQWERPEVWPHLSLYYAFSAYSSPQTCGLGKIILGIWLSLKLLGADFMPIPASKLKGDSVPLSSSALKKC